MTNARAIAREVQIVADRLGVAAAIALDDTDMPPLARLEGLLVCIEEARDRLNEILKGEGDG